jgi:23S rRNA (uridine2552-2'-O)-methyltransferase
LLKATLLTRDPEGEGQGCLKVAFSSKALFPGCMTRRWVKERQRDPYYRAAQRDGLRSRAAFKLLQLHQHLSIIPYGAKVLDLGAAPGGWSLTAKELVGARGHVTAIDLRNFEPMEGVTFIRGRVGSPEILERLKGETFDVILSDMSPSISGNYSTDHARSVDLVRCAMGLAQHLLVPGGTFVAKLFDGDMTKELRSELSMMFEKVQFTKPMASRSQSSEIYLVCRRFHGAVEPHV